MAGNSIKSFNFGQNTTTMNKIFTLLLFTIASMFGLNAQNAVYLNINHKLGEEDFEMNKMAQNNLDENFLVTRMEYYLSEISITHDGGTVTNFEDTWILVDAGKKTNINLGNFDINNVEKIEFYIGVDATHNHTDPASYPANHPLSPKFPSMHWGWTAGYRFVAMEGFCGSNMDQVFQLHGLGDSNYSSVSIDLNAIPVDGQVTISLNADYTQALKNIDIQYGVVVHGESDEAQVCINNLARNVFTVSESTSATEEELQSIQFDIYPTVVSEDFIKVLFNDSNVNYGDLVISDTSGKILQNNLGVKNEEVIQLNGLNAGIYFVSLQVGHKTIATKRIVIQ